MAKTLILFDKENQLGEVQLIKDWNISRMFDYHGYLIRGRVEDIDLSDYELFIVLIGESTKYLGSQFYGVVMEIASTDRPILCLN